MFCRPGNVSLLCALLIQTGALADQSSIRVREWTTDEGLPQNRINCLKQTSDGYLWMGTWFGLVRFDGVAFTVFNQFNTPAFKEDTVNALAEDARGTLWIGTYGGLLTYSNHEFKRFSTNDGLPSDEIRRLASSRNGGVWVQSKMSVLHFNQGKCSPVWNASGAPGSRINCLEERPDGWANIVMDH